MNNRISGSDGFCFICIDVCRNSNLIWHKLNSLIALQLLKKLFNVWKNEMFSHIFYNNHTNVHLQKYYNFQKFQDYNYYLLLIFL